MALYPFPDVPNSPGVPPLPRLPFNRISTKVQTVAANLAILVAGQDAPQWGIYDSSGALLGKLPDNTAVEVTSVKSAAQRYLQQSSSDSGPFTLAFDYRKETLISEFPVEEGSFAAYNKVERPGNPFVTLIASGTEDQRAAFLDAIDAACISTDLFSVVTPEFVYYNHSIESYSYQRTNQRGANVLIVELSLKEIRTVSAAYTTATTPANATIKEPQDASATPATNNGMVQATTPQQSTLKSLYNKMPELLNNLKGSILGGN